MSGLRPSNDAHVAIFDFDRPNSTLSIFAFFFKVSGSLPSNDAHVAIFDFDRPNSTLRIRIVASSVDTGIETKCAGFMSRLCVFKNFWRSRTFVS